MLPDPQTVATTLTAIRGVMKQFSDTTWKSAIIDLQNLLMELQGQAMDLQNELHRAQMRVRELEVLLAAKQADPKDGLTFDRGVWWAGESREVSAEGPYRPKCLEDGEGRRTLSRVKRSDHAQCLKCENWYLVWPEDTPPPQAPPRGDWIGLY